jgi:SAM-dependent methyltransferase
MDEPTDARRAPAAGRALIVPMRDEVARIERSLATLAASSLAADGLELVLVDDGSIDATAEVARGAAARLGLSARVLSLPAGAGKGAAVRAGMLATDAPVRVFVDADLRVDTKDLVRCFEALESGAADVAYGTRAHPDSRLPRSQPTHRVASGRTYNLLLRALGLTEERDTQCGMKGFTGPAAEAIFGPLQTPGFGFDVEVLARAERGGWRTEPLPVTWSHVDGSRVRALRDGVAMGASALAVHRRLGREGPTAPHARARGSTGSMAHEAMDAMARVERDHWWFRAKRSLVADQLERFGGMTGPLLDVGCGTGGLLDELGQQRTVVGLEAEAHALARAADLVTGARVVRGDAGSLPFRGGAVGVVTALDVVEHLDDDVAALRELARAAGDGLVVVAVPAYGWAWSDHDVRLGHRRRYTRRALEEAARAADLEVLRSTHFHSWLAPIAVVVRRTPVGRLLRGSAEEASYVHPAVNAVLHGLTALERRVLRRVDLPVGLSILLVARSAADPRR